MRNFINACIFGAITALIIVVASIDFVGTVALSIIMMTSLFVSAAIWQPVRSYAGFMVHNLGRYNNHRLALLAGLTAVTFLMAYKYGAGEPLLFSMVDDVSTQISQSISQEKERTAYTFLWGKKNAEEKYSPKIQTDTPPKEKKSWFLWKLFFTMLVITTFYVPFAFADEVAEFFENAANRLKNMGEEVKNVAPETIATVAESAVKATKTTARMGLFGSLYESGLATDFIIRLLKNLSGLFGRR